MCLELVGEVGLLGHGVLHTYSTIILHCPAVSTVYFPKPPDRYTPVRDVQAIAHVHTHTHTQQSTSLGLETFDLKDHPFAHDFLACPARAEKVCMCGERSYKRHCLTSGPIRTDSVQRLAEPQTKHVQSPAVCAIISIICIF
jgi:hypothetical protein